MLVLIDESGCPGFKLDKGSTPFFVVAMVIFNDFNVAEQTSATIGELRENLRVKPEFKFNKSSNDVRDSFFDAIINYDFSLRALVAEKKAIYSKYLRENKESFYNFFIRSLMSYDEKHLNAAKVKIDGSGGKVFQNSLTSYLRKQLPESKVKNVKLVDSKRDNLVQLADMVVGAIARSYNVTRKDNDRWLKKLRNGGRIGNIWNFV